MNKITDFTLDKQIFNLLRHDVENALKSVAEKYGIEITAGSISYTNEYCTMKITASVISESGEVLTKEKADFKKYAELFDLKPEDLGRTFKLNNSTFEIVGLKPSSRKFPIIGRNVASNKRFKFTSSMVQFGMEKQMPKMSRTKRG